MSINSCISLRYTDYGRPFDFLKSKNAFVYHRSDIKDTANIYVSQKGERNDTIDLKESVIIDPVFLNLTTISIEKPEFSEISDQVSGKTDENSKQGGKIERKFSKRMGHNKFSHLLLDTHPNILNFKDSPWPDWFVKACSAIWKFFLKWVLIAIAAFIVIVGLIFGIYYLLGLIGPAWIAFIVVFIIILALLIFTGIDLTWILNFL